MHFSKTAILAAVGTILPAVQAIACPGANATIYPIPNSSGKLYQISCSLEAWTASNLASYRVPNPYACADQCAVWSGPGECAGSSWDSRNTGVNCFLKRQGDAITWKNTEAVTTLMYYGKRC